MATVQGSAVVAVGQSDGGIMIALLDQHIGELRQLLREECLDQNTIILVTSDHGPAFGLKANWILVGRYEARNAPLRRRYPCAFDLFFGERYPNQTNFSTLERGLLEVKATGICQDHTRFSLRFNAQFDALLSITNDYMSRFGEWMRDYIDRTQRDGTPNDVRRRRMNKVNPKYVLRNYQAQLAIDKAEEGDNSMVDELLELLRYPYDEQLDKQAYAVKRPEWVPHRAGCSMLSCSS
ncbi:MAG: protein adenylyltransferase SelO family protein [Candidatus Poribacteria bacterium]|nr:protein adenylyltransferase SelO family protein [Candidatus Poribacteria bacterium]MDP6962172.1 protein adenylyltransferase SelO family protein [Dehalococcoidia bacterium]